VIDRTALLPMTPSSLQGYAASRKNGNISHNYRCMYQLEGFLSYDSLDRTGVVSPVRRRKLILALKVRLHLQHRSSLS